MSAGPQLEELFPYFFLSLSALQFFQGKKKAIFYIIAQQTKVQNQSHI